MDIFISWLSPCLPPHSGPFSQQMLTVFLHTISWIESFIISTFKTWLYEVIWEWYQSYSSKDSSAWWKSFRACRTTNVLHTPQICKLVLDNMLCATCVDGLYCPAPCAACMALRILQTTGRTFPKKWCSWMGYRSVCTFSLTYQASCTTRVTVTLVCSFRWMASPLWTCHTVILHPISICQGVRFLSVYI